MNWNCVSELEEWRDIPGFEGLYQISSHGRVRSFYTNKILKPGIDKRGYTRVTLVKDKKCTYHRVNRLVAVAFIPNPDNKKLVLHKIPVDPGYCNNHYTNLYWGDEYDNNNDTVVQQRGNGIPVYQYTKMGDLIAVYNSCREAGRKNKLKHEYIASCCRGERKEYDGYIWKYNKEVKNGMEI